MSCVAARQLDPQPHVAPHSCLAFLWGWVSSTAKERANEILNYSNQIASLQKQLEVSCMNVLRVQVR